MNTKWSKRIKKRDGYRCVVCGSKQHPSAHHLFSKSAYPALKNHKDNGITLCRFGCHQQFHDEYGSINTPVQFMNWYVDQLLADKVINETQLITVIERCHLACKAYESLCLQEESMKEAAFAKEMALIGN
ncbi:hypothetical protein C1X05_04055 [Laceyella sacchari]|jgi:hypothetical protein|uniref:HNH endonuclease n=1 Tax=Laceyella tengchongensis TaxID=574699 RepID=A0AA46AD49_9BACL|nr:hypothetical protein [Laceyella tengchongensis]AUS08078.1 hypothetical protein C1X05_04055 [Laceyella sacchari]MRG27088.1 hypothetical protein [Laceyella tengchongensis]SMP02408.1 hypothetical protein SAMN06265361_101339 [Laceyella tengchongensis]